MLLDSVSTFFFNISVPKMKGLINFNSTKKSQIFFKEGMISGLKDVKVVRLGED